MLTCVGSVPVTISASGGLAPELVEPLVARLDHFGDRLRPRDLSDRVQVEVTPALSGPSAARRNWFSVSTNAESGMLFTSATVIGRGVGLVVSVTSIVVMKQHGPLRPSPSMSSWSRSIGSSAPESHFPRNRGCLRSRSTIVR